MARNPKLQIDVTADDKQAQKALESIAKSADELNKMGVKPTVEVDDEATDELRDIRGQLERLDGDEARLLLRAETKDARRDLVALQRELIALDGDRPEVEVRADVDEAKRRLEALQTEVRELDAMDPEIDVRGLDGVVEGLEQMPGPMGDVVGGFQKLGPGGLIAAGATAAFTLANHTADMAVEAKTYADLTGASVEDSSRLLAVSRQVGIELGDLSDITLQTTQGLRDNAEHAEKLGINLADGKSPAQRLVEVLDKMNDPMLDATDKAEIFGALLGEEGVRQGQRMVSQLGSISDAMADVNDNNVFTEGDAREALAFKNTMNELVLQLQGVAQTIGQELVPQLEGVGSALAEVGELTAWYTESPLKDLVQAFSIIANPVGQATKAFGELRDVFMTDLDGGVADDLSTKTALLADNSMRAAQRASELAWELENEEAAAEGAADAAEAHAEALQAEVDAAQEAIDAIDEMVDAKLAAIDSTFALHDAEDDYAAALDDLIAVQGDEESTLRDIRQAHDAAQESALKLGEASVQAANDAAGGSLTASQKTEIWNASMAESAATASGPVRAAILGHIRSVNNIPEDKMTEIQAAIDRGDVAEANRLINDASRTRKSQINVQTNAWNANAIIDRVARDRHSNIWVHARGDVWARYGNTSYARGTPYAGGGMALVGEEGPELVNLPQGAAVTDAQASKGKMNRMGSGGGSVGGSGNTYNIVQNFPAGTRPNDVKHSMRKYDRIQGPL